MISDRLSFQRRTGIEPFDYDRREVDPAPAHLFTMPLPDPRAPQHRRRWRYGKYGPELDPGEKF